MAKTGKIVTIILWALLVVSGILVVSLMVNIDEANKQDPTMLGWVNTNIVWSYILVAFGAGIAVIAGLINTVTDKKAAKGGLIALVFMGAVILVAYLLASPEIPRFLGVDKFINDGTLTAQVAKMVDTGLYATYILLGIAVLSILVTAVTNAFK